jgi:hypothetical protein
MAENKFQNCKDNKNAVSSLENVPIFLVEDPS